ncbi:MAG: hypothetical protein AAF744_03390 [Pseudomonadota bacterium]
MTKGVCIFDLVTTHASLKPSQTGAQRFLKHCDLKLPEFGVWGPYVKLPSRSRMNFAFSFDGECDEAIEKLLGWHDALRATTWESEAHQMQESHASRMQMNSMAQMHDGRFTEVIVPSIFDIQTDMSWLLLWWSQNAEIVAIWDRIRARHSWIELEDYYQGPFDPAIWPEGEYY